MQNLPEKEEYEKSLYYPSRWSEPLYKCPKCGKGMRRDNEIILPSYPAKSRYCCEVCGYVEAW